MKFIEELHLPKQLNPYQKVLLNLLYTATWLDNKMQKELRHFHLTLPQYNVLRILRTQNGESLNAFDIQKRMVHPESNVTRIIEKLIEKKLVSRMDCKDNRRKIDISITDEGLNMLKKTDYLTLNNMEVFKSVLEPAEADNLSDLLDKVRINFISIYS